MVKALVDATLRSPWKLYLFLCCFRILNVLLVRSFFDPDEYWQTLEPAYCAVFRPDEGMACGGYTWEWQQRATTGASDDHKDNLFTRSLHGPLRSYLSVLPVHALYRLLPWMGTDHHYWIARGPMYSSAITVAAPIDLAVYYISDSRWALFASLTSWFGAFCYVRTYTNGQEALLLIVALALMQKNGHHNWHRCALAFFLGGLSVAIRFTSIASFVPLGLLLTLEQKPHRKLLFLLAICVPFGLLGILTAAVVDRWFYGFWTFTFLANIHFNAVLGRAVLYGTHPWFWYLVVGIPVVAGLLYPLLLEDTYRWISAFAAPFRERMRQQLWSIIITYTIALSTSAHKEFRFLLPVLPLLCILLEARVGLLMKQKWPVWIILWAAPNLVAVLYLGLFHQSGSVAVMHDVIDAIVRNGRPNATLHLLLPCHATPYYSYLHTRGGRHDLTVWHLACPPECRTNATCESDLFTTRPGPFLADQYQKRARPDYVITSTAYERAVTAELGLVPLVRRFHSITGIQWGDGGGATGTANNEFTVGGVTLLIDEMIVMGRKDDVTGLATILDQQPITPDF
jgi:GPI mannosyltransferase 3